MSTTTHPAAIPDTHELCSRCHTPTFIPDLAYYGPEEEGSTTCHPFVAFKAICHDCATPEELTRWYGTTTQKEGTPA